MPDAARSARPDRPPPMTYMAWFGSQGVELGATAVDQWFWRCPHRGCQAWAGPYRYPAHHGPDAAKDVGMDHVWHHHTRPSLNQPPSREETKSMSNTPNQTGEATNLTSSIKFCEASAGSARDGIGEVETFAASISSVGVTGEPLRLAAQLMERLEQLGSVFDELGEELRSHQVVAEAYGSVGDDAGEKQFNQIT